MHELFLSGSVLAASGAALLAGALLRPPEDAVWATATMCVQKKGCCVKLGHATFGAAEEVCATGGTEVRVALREGGEYVLSPCDQRRRKVCLLVCLLLVLAAAAAASRVTGERPCMRAQSRT